MPQTRDYLISVKGINAMKVKNKKVYTKNGQKINILHLKNKNIN